MLGLYLLFFASSVLRIVAFQIVPSLYPLQYITPQAVCSYVLENTQEAIWSLLLPVDQQDAVAIFISEGISGFAGGLAAKGIALIDGNRNNKQASSLSFGETSGAYFGVSAAIRSLAQQAGLSSISVNIIGLLFGAGVSEFLKLRRQKIVSMRTRVGKGPTMYDLMKFKNPSMLDLMKFSKNENAEIKPRMEMMGETTTTEIAADLMKWLFLYCAVPRGNLDSLEDAVILGSVAGILSQLVREQKDREIDESIREYKRKQRALQRTQFAGNAQGIVRVRKYNSKETAYDWFPIKLWNKQEQKVEIDTFPPPSNRASKITFKESGSSAIKNPMPAMNERAQNDVRPDFVLARFARSSLECAVQVLTYEASRRYVMELGPYFRNSLDVIDATISTTN